MNFKRRLADLIFLYFPSIASVFGSIYGYFWSPRFSFSLYGEDLLAANFMKEACNLDRDGVYVDIGAFHPRWISNTHLLAKSGWKGVVVDISPGKLLPFKVFRRNVEVREAAIVPSDYEEKDVKVYEFQRMNSEWDTLDEAMALRMSARHNCEYKVRKVAALKISTLLEESCVRYGRIDYLNIDIEGMDDRVINGLDLRVFGIKVIQFENNDFFGGSFELRGHLKSIGYVHLGTNGGTHTWVDREILLAKFKL